MSALPFLFVMITFPESSWIEATSAQLRAPFLFPIWVSQPSGPAFKVRSWLLNNICGITDEIIVITSMAAEKAFPHITGSVLLNPIPTKPIQTNTAMAA